MRIDLPRAYHYMDGIVEGEKVICNRKLLKDIRQLYENAEGMAEDTLVYTVYSYEDCNAELGGELYWGLTILEPVTVHGECNMTRGHFHENRDCAEFYFGIEGEGFLLLMDEEGKTWAEVIEKGSLHHIAGVTAHRLINTGETVLKVGACWPTVAGHDYASIEEREFGYRIYKENGNVICKERK